MKIARQVALVLSIAAMILCSWLKPLDSPATQQVDAGLKRALVSFATARALNAVISVVQGTQISVQPAGIGATLTPGQLLAPVNELVKHFSDLMLVASVAFGIQKVLITISGYWAISFVLTATAIFWAAFYFQQRHPPAWLSKMLVVLLMLRFAIPVVALGSDMLSQRFLAADYVASQQAIDTASGQAEKIHSPDSTTSGNLSFLEKIKSWVGKIYDIKDNFENLKRAVEQATEHIVKLMVIFILQTLVIPIFLLWGLYAIVRITFESPKRLADT